MVSSITTTALRNLTSAQLDAFTSDQLRALSTGQINNLTTAQINGRLKDIHFRATAGQHTLAVTFLRRSYAESDSRTLQYQPGDDRRPANALEGGQQKLEDAISAYERGARLKAHCEAKLAEAEQRVQAIVAGGGHVVPVGEAEGLVWSEYRSSAPLADLLGDLAGFRMLATAPAAQGRGVGAALTTACIERARAEGAPGITLHTTDLMQAAQRLYRRLGFERWTASIRDYFAVYHLNRQLREENAELRKWQNVALLLEDKVRHYEQLLNVAPGRAAKRTYWPAKARISGRVAASRR